MAVPKLMLAAGGAIVLAALFWWWTTFGDVVRYGYLSWGEAGRCLVRDSDICALAKVLCLGSHPRLLIAYWTSAFWLGVGVLSMSLLTPPATKSFAREHWRFYRRRGARVAMNVAFRPDRGAPTIPRPSTGSCP